MRTCNDKSKDGFVDLGYVHVGLHTNNMFLCCPEAGILNIL